MPSPSGRMHVTARVGVDLPGHERLLSIPKGPLRAAALGLWTAATCMCRKRETDGFCALEWIESFATEESLNRLVEVGLFAMEERRGVPGVRVLRYDEFNETKSQIEKRLRQDRQRKNSRRNPGGIRSDSVRNPNGIQGDSAWKAGMEMERRPSCISDLSDSDLELSTGAVDNSLQAEAISASVAEDVVRDGDVSKTLPDRQGVPANGNIEADRRRPSTVMDDGEFGLAVTAWAEGIRLVTGKPFTTPRGGTAELTKLVDAISDHGPAIGRGKRVDWVRKTATEFARAQAGNKLNAHAFLDWLNSGKPVRGAKPEPAGAVTYDGPAIKAERALRERSYKEAEQNAVPAPIGDLMAAIGARRSSP